MSRLLSLGSVILATLVVGVFSHTYHLGECPNVEPMSGFDMNKFLGIWNVVQKTSTGSKCLYYNFTRTEEPGHFLIEQVSEHPILGIASVDNKYHYTGTLRQVSLDVPAKFKVNFPLNPAGSSDYVVFMTDYDTYAGIYTCQKLPASNRRSVSVLSRAKTLDKDIIDKIRRRVSLFGVNPFDLSIINHSGCPATTSVDLSIDPDTFSASNIAGVVRKAGEKLGDGIEVAVDGAKRAYNAVKSEDEIERLS